MKKKQASTLVFLIAMMGVFLALSAFAVDGTIILTKRFKLQNITESTALNSVSEFDTHSPKTLEEMKTFTKNLFDTLKINGLETATSDIDIDMTSNKILVKSTYIAKPYFLVFMGVNGVKLEAKAAAANETLTVSASYAGINWLSAKASYKTDILSEDENLHDTAILLPVGGYKSASIDHDGTNTAKFELISADDSKPLSLGSGGFITIKLPAPLINKTGIDLYIKELGALEGYMVFAGIDNSPTDPYSNNSKQGAGVSWTNITCAAENSDVDTSILFSNATELGSQDTVFGSAYFDLSNSCLSGKDISMVKYLRIIDDNSEKAIVQDEHNSKYYKAMLYGESSSSTPGADIDVVKIFNFARLINPEDY